MTEHGIVFDHIAIGLPRIADAPEVLVGALGGVPEAAARSRGFNWGCWRFAGGGRVEILEPSGTDGFLHRFLAERGSGIHHVTFKVASLRDACQRAEAHGYEIVGRDESHPGWKEAFLHPKQALGIVVQFAEAAGDDRPPFRMPLPPEPPSPPPVMILGLRLRARSRKRARTQWEGVLQGEGSVGEDGAVVYRWPGSPMRIAVEIDSAAEEGPIGIELASERPITLAERPLGVAWLTRSAGAQKGGSR